MVEPIQEFIAPIDAQDVAGINIEYDADFQNLLMIIQDKPEQQFGDLIIEATGIDWDKVYNISRDLLLHKSKDLLVMSYFTQSSTVLYGLVGFANGLKVISENLEQYWQQVYPHLEDEDGDFDPDYRVNALSLFYSYDGIIKELRNAFLVKNGLSQAPFTIKEIEGLLDNRADMTDKYPGGLDRLSIDLQIALDNQAPEMIAIQDALAALGKIRSLFDSNLDDVDIKFDNIEQLLHKIQKAVGVVAPSTDILPVVTETVAQSSESPNAIKPTHVNWSGFQVTTRQDVELLLEKIFVYFEKYEPTHPAPLFIRRIQRLMNLNFYEIMRDISPESLDRLDLLVGQPIDNSSDNYEND